MKIAFFSDCYLDLTGGIVSLINAQKAALEADGHTVSVFSTGFPRSEAELGKLARDHIYQVPSCRFLFRGATPVPRRPKLIENWLLTHHPELETYDIFYVHYEAGCSIAGLRLARKLGIPSVQVMHGREDEGEAAIIPYGFRTFVAAALNWFHSWYIPHPVKIRRDDYLADTISKAKMWTLMINHAKYADYVITPSEHFRKKLAHYGLNSAIKVIPNGYPDAKFPQQPAIKALAPGQELRMIWHSRISGEKRILPFLQALTKLDGRYRLDVYGGGEDLPRARRYAKSHHLNATFHGDTKFDRVQAAILQSHLDILVSYNFDDYPLTLVEAEAAGVPAFICDKDMREIIPKGSYLLSSGPDPSAMAAALNHLLAHPDLIRKMSQTMLEHRDEVLISRRVKPLEDYFASIIKSRT